MGESKQIDLTIDFATFEELKEALDRHADYVMKETRSKRIELHSTTGDEAIVYEVKN